MKTAQYLQPSKPEGGHESGLRKVRFLGPTATTGHQRSPEVAEYPQNVPTKIGNGRAGLGRVVSEIGESLARLSRLAKKPNRRNGGGPRLGNNFEGINLEAARERFERKYAVEPNTGCWLWFGATNTRGYGSFAVVSRQPIVVVCAHRYAFTLHRGAIPEGLTLDHLCRQPACVNPAHMEAVTIEENVSRSHRFKTLKTECAHGHPYSGANLYVSASGKRKCRACGNSSRRRLLAAVRAGGDR